MPTGIVRQSCVEDMHDKPMKSNENRANASVQQERDIQSICSIVGPKQQGEGMNEQPRDYDHELARLLETTRQHGQGLPFPIAQPIQDYVSHSPTLTWVVESSGESKSAENAHS